MADLHTTYLNTYSVITAHDPIDMGSNQITSHPAFDDDELIPYERTQLQYAHYKNYIMNGAFNIAQRGTSFAAIANQAYHLDRWYHGITGTAVHTVTQDTDVPTTSTTQYSLKVDCTTADAAIAAGDNCTIEQRIEGYIFRPLVGKIATLSFWVKATKTGIYCVSFTSSNGDRSYVAEYTINVTNTWEYKTITLTFNYSGGTWDYTNGKGIHVRFALSCGSTYQTTANAWASGNYIGTSNQVNGTDSTDNNFWLTEVMLNEGSTAMSFRMFGNDWLDEFQACQRYYEKSFDYATAPADNAGVIGAQHTKTTMTSSYWHFDEVYFKITKRTNTAPTVYNPGAASATTIRNITDSTNHNSVNTYYGTVDYFPRVNNSSIATGKTLAYHWAVNAEL